MLATESVLGVIERQRQDQERLLRSLADGKASSACLSTSTPMETKRVYYHVELSDDIRGERLRFVEAMKEATAIKRSE